MLPHKNELNQPGYGIAARHEEFQPEETQISPENRQVRLPRKRNARGFRPRI